MIEGNSGGRLLAARRAARCARSARSRASCTPGRMAAVSGARSTRVRAGRRSSPPQRGPDAQHASRDRGQRASPTARRACTSTKATPTQAASTAGSSAATTWPAERPSSPNLSNTSPARATATYNVCTGQCWYDSFVYTPAGHPDVVYVGGSYSYGEALLEQARCRALDRRRRERHGHDDGRHRHLSIRTACIPTSTRSSRIRATRSSSSR